MTRGLHLAIGLLTASALACGSAEHDRGVQGSEPEPASLEGSPPEPQTPPGPGAGVSTCPGGPDLLPERVEAVLARIAVMIPRDVHANDAEGVLELLVGAVEDEVLLGQSRDVLVERFGPPSTSDYGGGAADEVKWVVGAVPEGLRAGPPLLFVRVDGRGCVVGARMLGSQ